ncbi:uncharacterized protein [Amphiura filiformis]|uniref:uncharacterized protein n=1 Tax=Amphiura filiformis TaxID=82378 RepID=UPI003B221D72
MALESSQPNRSCWCPLLCCFAEKKDVPHDTAESKKEEEKDSSGKTDIQHDTAESKKEEEKDSSGKTGHVMISYSWGAEEDHYPCQQRMIKLRDELIAGGYRVWMDLDEMAGNMDDRMSEAVEKAYAILICVSEKYQKSANCKKEAQYAFFLKRPIIILKYDDHTPDGWLGLQINSLLYYDVQTEEAMMTNLPKIKEQLNKGKSPTRQTDHDPENNEGKSPRQTDHDPEINEGLTEKIAIELRKHYKNTICKKQIYPWQTGECIDFDTVYIPVTIDRIVESGLTPIRESLKSYQDLFTIEEDKDHRRFLLVGSPGQGKSSFCAKLAHDWCCGKTLNDIRLLFILELASVNRKVRIEEEIRKKLLKNIEISDYEISKVIQSDKKSIFFIFDGLDEAPKDIFLRDDDIGVVEIMKNDVLTECRLLVTTRPWREDEILKKVPGYKRLELKKMTRNDVKEYIDKLFGMNEETKSLGKSLLEYIDSNKLTIDTHTPLVVLLLSWYWTQTKGKDGIPERIADLYDRMTNIMHEKSSTGLSKKRMIRKLGEMSAKTLTATETHIVFTKEEAIDKLGGEGILVQCQKCGILCDKGSGSVQFFHKSGQEFCAGVYLNENPDKLSEYLKEIEEVQEALNLGLVLVFAAGSNKEAAKTIVKKLVELFTTDDCCNKYYSVKDDKVRHPVLNYEQSRQVQRLIELLLECYYEGQIGDEMRDSLKPVFLNGQVLFTGLTQKLASSVSYYMRYCGEDVKQIHLHPIPHAQEKIEEIEKGAMRQVFADTVNAMKKRDISDLKRQCDRFVTANQATISDEIRKKHKWACIDNDACTHDAAVKLAAYISCLETTAGLPSSNEIDFTPIINSLGFCPNLRRLNCQEGYFGLANNVKYLLQQIINDSINPRTLAVISELDASSLTYRGVCSNASDVTRVIKSIPKMINLHKLDISRNEFEPGVTSSVLADSLTQCTQLQEFKMRNMEGVTCSDMNTIFTGFIAFLVSLRKLTISYNPLPNVDSVKCLRKCQALERIDLMYMKGAKEDEMAALITTAGELPQLTTLNLISNPVINGSKCFSAILSILPQLRILYLGFIGFTKERLETLISTSRNTSMQELRLTASSLGDNYLPEGVQKEDFKDDFIKWEG